eukprot:3926121-Lingulodinium_polyedra.AAC.1
MRTTACAFACGRGREVLPAMPPRARGGPQDVWLRVPAGPTSVLRTPRLPGAVWRRGVRRPWPPA